MFFVAYTVSDFYSVENHIKTQVKNENTELSRKLGPESKKNMNKISSPCNFTYSTKISGKLGYKQKKFFWGEMIYLSELAG